MGDRVQQLLIDNDEDSSDLRSRRRKQPGGLGHFHYTGGDRVRPRDFPMALVTAGMVSVPSLVFLVFM
jgi:hypothetical protein